MNIFRSTGYAVHAVTKIAHLTSVFERLVAEAGARAGRIEQLLAELADDRTDAKTRPRISANALRSSARLLGIAVRQSSLPSNSSDT